MVVVASQESKKAPGRQSKDFLLTLTILNSCHRGFYCAAPPAPAHVEARAACDFRQLVLPPPARSFFFLLLSFRRLYNTSIDHALDNVGVGPETVLVGKWPRQLNHAWFCGLRQFLHDDRLMLRARWVSLRRSHGSGCVGCGSLLDSRLLRAR